MFVVAVDYKEAPNIMNELTKVLSPCLSHIVVCRHRRLRPLASFGSPRDNAEAVDEFASVVRSEFHRPQGVRNRSTSVRTSTWAVGNESGHSGDGGVYAYRCDCDRFPFVSHVGQVKNTHLAESGLHSACTSFSLSVLYLRHIPSM